MCHEYWHERKERQEAEERARKEAATAIEKMRRRGSAPAETEKEPAENKQTVPA